MVAETREAAYDALELIDVAYEALPAVVDEEAAIAKRAPQLHERFQTTLRRIFKTGGGDYTAVARQADQVLRLRVVNNRLIPTCLETRAILAEPGLDDGLTLYLPSQVDRSKFWKELSMPFYGYNKPGAKVSEGVRASFWLQDMMTGLPAAYFCIETFSDRCRSRLPFSASPKRGRSPVLKRPSPALGTQQAYSRNGSWSIYRGSAEAKEQRLLLFLF